MARDDDAVLVEDSDGRVPVESEGAGQFGVRVRERGPRPPVLAQELPRLVPIVGDVQADKLILRMALDEACVGDRLAVADGSPGRPDVDEDRPPTELGEREPAAVERLALEHNARGARGGAGSPGAAPRAAPATG